MLNEVVTVSSSGSSLAIAGATVHLKDQADPGARATLQHIAHCARHHAALVAIAKEYSETAAQALLDLDGAGLVSQNDEQKTASQDASRKRTVSLLDPVDEAQEKAIRHLKNCADQHPALLRVARKYLLIATFGDAPAEKCEELLRVVSDASALPSPRPKMKMT